MTQVRSSAAAVLRFLYAYIFGDDWTVAVAVVIGLLVTAILHASRVDAWWLIPLIVIAMTGVSLRRAGRRGGEPDDGVIRAVVFDLDGVLLDSEQLWDEARREVVAERHGRWLPEATLAMQGMSSIEWSRYLHEKLEVDLSPERISDLVVATLLERYRRKLPLLPGSVEAVKRLGKRWRLALASSANRPVIDEVVVLAGLRDLFDATVSSEEVPRGKPAPDVYLEAARRLGEAAAACAAIEDSANGIRSAVAAGMKVVAVPNREYPPPETILADARLVVSSLTELTADMVASLWE